MRYLLIFSLLFLMGCATPHEYSVTKTEDGLKLTGKRTWSFFGLFEKEQDCLPGGKYKGVVGDRSLEVDTKAEPLKLMGDVNANKVGG